MIQVGVGFSDSKDHIEAAKEALGQAGIHIRKEDVDLALVFSSIEYAHPLVPKTIASFLGAAPIAGCSSLALISQQGVSTHGLLVMLLGFPEGVYCNCACITEIDAASAMQKGAELAERLLYGFKDIPRDLGLIFFDGLIQNSSPFIHGLQEKLGLSFPVVGACASDNRFLSTTYLYYNDKLLNAAACGILLGGKLRFGLGIKHGWKPLGKPRRVTKSRENTVDEIDGEPAIKFYEEYLGKDSAQLQEELKRISILYPVGIYLPGESEYLLRNVTAVTNGSLVFQGDIPEDSHIRLMIGTKETCLEASRQAAEEALTGLKGQEPNCVLVFDSTSRYLLLGRQARQELEIIRKIAAQETPIVGMYAYGEQAPVRAISYLGKTYFHNQTITVLALGA